MKIIMDTLTITNYCDANKRMEYFCKGIEEDPLFNQFISHNVRACLEDSMDMTQLLVGPGKEINKGSIQCAENAGYKLTGEILPKKWGW